MPGNDPRLYNVADVAAMCRVAKATVYRLIASGDLEAIRVGRAVRVPVDSLSRFIDARRPKGDAA